MMYINSVNAAPLDIPMSITIKRTSQLTTKMHYLTAEMRFIKSDCAIFSDASK